MKVGLNEGHKATQTGKHIMFLHGMSLYRDSYLKIYLAVMLFGRHFSFPLRIVISPQFTQGNGEPLSPKFFHCLTGRKPSGKLAHMFASPVLLPVAVLVI